MSHMLNRILILLAVILAVLFFSNKSVLQSIRSSVEKKIVLPFRNIGLKDKKQEKSLRVGALEEKIRVLSAENKTLRTQLGAIPERHSLYPTRIIWYSEANFELSFPYQIKKNLTGKAVVWEEMFVGFVKRHNGNMLYIEQPLSSNFTSLALSDRKTKGTVKGNFNQEVYFETEQKESLAVGDRVYVIDKEDGLQYFLGLVKNVENDKRLPVKRGIIDYLFSPKIVSTVFVAL
jgi:hypothetical protein